MKVDNNIRAVVDDLLNEYKNKIVDSGHNASGNLVSSSKHIIKWEDGAFIVDFEMPKYWEYLEDGTPPHKPPLDILEEWVRVKPGVPPAIDGRVPTNRQFAYLVQRRMGGYTKKDGTVVEGGTPAYNLLQETLDSNEELIDKLCDLIMDKIIEQLDD